MPRICLLAKIVLSNIVHVDPICNKHWVAKYDTRFSTVMWNESWSSNKSSDQEMHTHIIV